MEPILKSTREQAVAAWIEYLKQLRLAMRLEKLFAQDANFEMAAEEIDKLKQNVEDLIASNRGHDHGLHGFLAEAAEVGISNARRLIKGLEPVCAWINDNGPADIQYADGTLVQMKFVQKYFSIGYKGSEQSDPGGFYHTLKKYPEFIERGGKLMPPKDFYEKIVKIWNTPIEEASKWTSNDPISFTQWKAIREFFETTGATPDDFKPSLLEYREVQKGTIRRTVAEEEQRLRETDQELRREIFEETRPTLKEAGTVTAVSAAIEGGAAFCSSVVKKRKSGKTMTEFTVEDWKEIGLDTGAATAKGGIRGAAVYVISNFTNTPANVATGLVTATFGVTAQAKLLREGKIEKEDFLINSEALCLDVSISTVSSVLGQTVIPIPILGAIIGNVAGMFLYDIVKNQGLEREQNLIAGYHSEIKILDQQLETQYQHLRSMLKKEFERFESLLEFAFNKDVNLAFAGSIELARVSGVPEEDILKTKAEIASYFLK